MSFKEGQREVVEAPTEKPPIVLRCIDFRTNDKTSEWLADQGVLEGAYYLFASAGASGNPHGLLKDVRNHEPDSLLVVDHEDCGFYKAAGLYAEREDPNHAHHHNLETLGESLRLQNPNIKYTYHLVPMDETERQEHECPATAIMLGEPRIVLEAREKLARLGLSKHDEIARPYDLNVHDGTIWNDLRISLRLHKPTQIYIFEANPQKALEIADVAHKIAPELTIIPVVISRLSQRSRFATIIKRHEP